jgi:arsenite-transporting ATPase
VAEARRTLSALALRGIRVDGLIVNRLMPVARGWRGVAASWLRARRGQQDMVLAELAASGFAGFARVEHRAIEPVGLPALLEIAEELYGDGDPLLGAGGDQASPLLELSEVDGGYRLRVSLPLGRDTGVELARVDDDLSITVDGFRRLVALPERLRAYRVTGAESGPGGLVVSFAAMGKP